MSLLMHFNVKQRPLDTQVTKQPQSKNHFGSVDRLSKGKTARQRQKEKERSFHLVQEITADAIKIST